MELEGEAQIETPYALQMQRRSSKALTLARFLFRPLTDSSLF